MAARVGRLVVVLTLGVVLPASAAAAVVRPPTSQETAIPPVPARGAGLANARSYFGARYYRADIGRFTTVDPVYTWQENLEDPQRWNRYAYVRNNPLKYTDPDGKVPIPVVIAIAWGAYEIGSQIYDAYTAYRTVTDPNATGREKLGAVGGFALAAVAPGGGYGTAAKAAASTIDDAARLAVRTELHHAWPKYLGGPAKQVLAGLPQDLHREFHAGLDKLLPRRLGAEHYRKLTPTQQAKQFDLLRQYIEGFDKKHNTQLWEALKAVAK